MSRSSALASDSKTDVWYGDWGHCGLCLFVNGVTTILPNPYGRHVRQRRH